MTIDRPHVIVSSMYNGEISAKYLIKNVFDEVDEFILTEAAITHSGISKPFYFYKHHLADFAPYRGKLTILQIDHFPEMPEGWDPYSGMPEKEKHAWFREFYQRNVVTEYLDINYKNKKYILFCSDADEILNKATMVQTIDRATVDYNVFDSPHYLEMDQFNYNFTWKIRDKWILAFVCNGNALRISMPTEIRIQSRDATDDYIIRDGGWHCSYFASLKDIVRKIESYAHRELDHPVVRAEGHIRKCIKEGKDIFGPISNKPYRGDTKFSKNDPSQLPKVLLEFHAEVLSVQT
jgi:beta-1,4-mannosyl-glycoprotein beta-1,4-N-acetylglucosaminyltransferase